MPSLGIPLQILLMEQCKPRNRALQNIFNRDPFVVGYLPNYIAEIKTNGASEMYLQIFVVLIFHHIVLEEIGETLVSQLITIRFLKMLKNKFGETGQECSRLFLFDRLFPKPLRGSREIAREIVWPNSLASRYESNQRLTVCPSKCPILHLPKSNLNWIHYQQFFRHRTSRNLNRCLEYKRCLARVRTARALLPTSPTLLQCWPWKIF